MGRTQRISFAVIAAIVAVVALVVLGGSSDEKTNKADTPPATAVSTATPQPQEASPAGTPTPAPTPAIETIRFRDGDVVGGLAKLKFEKGETVRFAVTADVADEVHVHGYDFHKDVTPGGTVRFSFPAKIEGVFEVELEDKGIQLAQLTVDP